VGASSTNRALSLAPSSSRTRSSFVWPEAVHYHNLPGVEDGPRRPWGVGLLPTPWCQGPYPGGHGRSLHDLRDVGVHAGPRDGLPERLAQDDVHLPDRSRGEPDPSRGLILVGFAFVTGTFSRSEMLAFRLSPLAFRLWPYGDL
jgi:hypothetical protein